MALRAENVRLNRIILGTHAHHLLMELNDFEYVEHRFSEDWRDAYHRILRDISSLDGTFFVPVVRRGNGDIIAVGSVPVSTFDMDPDANTNADTSVELDQCHITGNSALVTSVKLDGDEHERILVTLDGYEGSLAMPVAAAPYMAPLLGQRVECFTSRNNGIWSVETVCAIPVTHLARR